MASGHRAATRKKASASRKSSLATVDVELRVNATSMRLALDPRTTLLDALREQLRLTGTK
jgi:xanthine dehydrogenase YagT iron-sulfur-binding subunit